MLLNVTKTVQIFDKFKFWMPQRNQSFDRYEVVFIEEEDRKKKRNFSNSIHNLLSLVYNRKPLNKQK